MSREIKFRAYVKARGMTYFANPIISNSELQAGERWGLFFPSSAGVWLCQYSDPMQFTGTLDRNGREIWEGDVITTEYQTEDGPVTSKSVVEWLDGFGFTLPGISEEIEVLGNIYENPELLEPA